MTCQETHEGAELTGPIIAKAATKQIAYAAVLVPGEPDSDGDAVTKEKIEQVAHNWLANYGNVDLQHSLNNVAKPVESYLTTEPQTVTVKDEDVELPEGSWVLASKIDDQETWNDVASGNLTGYSIMGVPGAAMKSKDVALKRTLLSDLGGDWVAPFVSVVDEPAVPKAKFFALKSKAEESGGFFARLFKSKQEDEMTEELKEELDTVKKEHGEALETLQNSVDELKDQLSDPEEDPPEEDPPEVVEKEEFDSVKDELEDARGELDAATKRIDELEKKRTPSKQLGEGDGDGNEGDEPAFKNRDAYGRYRPSDD